MVNDNAPENTPRDCLRRCNLVSTCKFWDFDTKWNTCRLRSNRGKGSEIDKPYAFGSKHCTIGTNFLI